MTTGDMSPQGPAREPAVRREQRVIHGFQGAWRFLSNFHESRASWGGVAYPTAEHAYQSAKSLDPEYRRRVAACPTPGEAKRTGRQAVLRPGWDGRVRRQAMLIVLVSKFTLSPELASWLAATGDAELVETNHWHDNFWGDCRCEQRPGCEEPGRNLLGRLLEGVRLACLED